MKQTALLVLVFTIIATCLSSFSLKSKISVIANRWEIFGVTPNTINGIQYQPDPAEVYSAKICDGFNGYANSFVEAFLLGFLDINGYMRTYNTNHFLHNAICSTDSEHICIATVEYYDSVSDDAILIDYKYGDYYLN
jgi:hypothetical protein